MKQLKYLIFISIALFIFSSLTAQEGGVRVPEGENTEDAVVPTENINTAPDTASMDKEKVYLNVQDQDIRDIIRQISKATGRNFIIDDKVRGKITIISERMMTQEEAYQAFLSALEVVGFTTVTGPGGIIKIVPTKQASQSAIPILVDTTPYTDSYVTRLISLNNINANDIQQILKTLVSPNGNVFAYPSTNTLIITDSGTNIDRLMKLIKELDQEGPQEVMEIIPIHYANAKEIANTFLTLYEIDKDSSTKTTTTRRTVSRAPAEPQLEEASKVSKIIADDRTNSIIVLASKRAIDDVRNIIMKLDTPIGAEGKIHVHYLKHANATDIAQTLSSLTSGASKTASKDGTAAGATAELEGGITIAADESTNALIISASAKDYNTLRTQLIDKLDIPRRQVYLESIVMELKLKKGFDYKLSGHGGKAFGMFMPFAQTFGAIGNLFDMGNMFNAGGMLGGVLSSDQVNIDVPSADGGSNTISIPAFSAFLNLLQTYTDSNVVSSPNILTLDNQESEINIIEKIYVDKVTTTATGIVSTEPIPLEAGLTLKIKPQISEGDMVRLEIYHELSNFEAASSATSTPPQTSRKIKTTVVAMDGQTIVLGGLMSDDTSHSRDKIPLLGDIPILGWLFKTTNSSSRKTNLLVFITPHVIRDPSDFSKITKSKIEERNRFIDDNYGKKQRESIRKTIASHRADLLDYVPPHPMGNMTGGTNFAPSSQSSGQMPNPSNPAITIGTDSKTSNDLDLAY